MAARPIRGGTVVVVPGEPGAVLAALLDPATLRRAVPAAESVERVGEGRYRAVIAVGVGLLSVRQVAEMTIGAGTEARPGCRALVATGRSSGALAWGEATGEALLEPCEGGRTRITWRYEGVVGGAAALAGDAALGLAARGFAARFFGNVRRVLG